MVVIGSGQIGQAIARRAGVGKHLLLADQRYGTALVLGSVAEVIATGGMGMVIASPSGHRLPPITDEQKTR